MRTCVRCVMSTEAEEITFNEKGVCGFCTAWERGEDERQTRKLHPGLPWMLYELRKAGEGKNYDCLVGLSGGVDSAMCLHYLVAENGIRPLCFSIDNGWNSPGADENIMRMVEKLKVPFYRKTIDLKTFNDLQIAFVRAGVKNIEIPTDHILLAICYQLAAENGIKYIVNGGNWATEGIMPESYGYSAKDLRHIKAIFKRFAPKELNFPVIRGAGVRTKKPKLNLPTISLGKYIYYRFVKGIKVIQPLDFYEYDRNKSIKLLEQEYGWQPYGEKHGESVFTRWFQNFYLPAKFGLDKRRPHFSSMIMSGQMTRTEALEELAKSPVYPKLGIEERIMAYEKHSHFDYPTNQRLWNFMYEVYRFMKNVVH